MKIRIIIQNGFQPIVDAIASVVNKIWKYVSKCSSKIIKVELNLWSYFYLIFDFDEETVLLHSMLTKENPLKKDLIVLWFEIFIHLKIEIYSF